MDDKNLENTNKMNKTKQKSFDHSQDKVNRPKKRNKSIIFILSVIILIILSIAIFINLKPDVQPDNYDYNNYEFFKDDMNMWNTYVKINGQIMQIQFNYHPTEVINLSVDPRIKQRIFMLDNEDHLIVSVDEDIDPIGVVATAQISRLYGVDYIKVPINGGLYDDEFNLTAFLQNETRDESIFITNCGITSDSFVVMRFKNANETSMKFVKGTDFNCINVNAQEPEEFRMLADRLVYELLGIIETN